MSAGYIPVPATSIEDRVQLAAYEPASIVKLVDRVCAEEGISRADYLRRLVRQDLRQRNPGKTLLELTSETVTLAE